MDDKTGYTDSQPIVVYDGHCNLCNRSLQFVLRNDRDGQFIYVPFQSPQGLAICDHFGIEFTGTTSMLLLEDGQLLERSRAWQSILARLSFGYRLVSGLIRVFPTSLSDRVYDFIGKRRYRWFGQTESCQLIAQNGLPDVTEIEKRLPSKPQ